MNDDLEKDLHYFLGYIASDLEQIKEDIAELKTEFIPEGKSRVSRVEVEVASLSKWRNTLVTISAGMTAIVGYVIHETINLWSKLNG